MILKTHLFIKNISRSVHKLCQHNKPPKIHSTHAEHLLLGEHLFGTVLKKLNYKTLLFTVTKRSLCTQIRSDFQFFF